MIFNTTLLVFREDVDTPETFKGQVPQQLVKWKVSLLVVKEPDDL